MKPFLIHNSGQTGRNLTTGLWCMVVLILLWQFIPLLFGNRTIIPVDNLFQFAPYQEAAEEFGVARPHIPLYSDLVLQNYPWWQFIHQSLDSGQLPLWNPFILSGTPFLAKGQHMALYPLSVLLYILPLERAYSYFLILHFGLAACTAAFLARTVGISRYGSLLSGIIYGLSGFMLARAVFPMIIAAAAWLPLVLAMTERIIARSRFRGRRSTLPWILFGGFGLGMQGLIGHPEILIYTLLTLSFYSVCRCLSVRPRRRMRPPAFSSLNHTLSSLVLMVMLGLLIGAAQLLPQYLVLQENFRRQAADFTQVLSWSYPWQQAITMLVPNYFGNPALYSYTNLFNGLTVSMPEPISWGTKNFVEGAGYMGILPLLLALAGLRRHPLPPVDTPSNHRPAPSPLLFFALAVLAFSFAYGTPLYYLIYALPGMEQIHSPFRWVMVSTLALAILAGYGIDRIRQQSPALIIARFCALGGALVLLALLLFRFFFPRLEPFVETMLLQSGGNATIFPDLELFFSYETPWLLLLAIMLIISGLALRTIRDAAHQGQRGGRSPFWQPLVVLVIVGDLLLFAYRLYPTADPALLRHTPEIISRMHDDEGHWRSTTFDPESRKSFPANTNWLHTIQDIRGYDSIFSTYYRSYMETIDVQDELLYNRIAPLRSPAALDSPLLDLLNVKYIMTENRIDNPRYQLADHGDGLLVYRNSGALPRAFSLPLSSTVLAEDPFAAMRRYDPRFYLILPTAEPANEVLSSMQPSTPTPGKPDVVRIDSYRNNEVIMSVSAAEPLWLVLADSYDRGWQAAAWQSFNPDRTIRPPIRRAYGALRAVMLEQGDWIVRFRYRPAGFVTGLSLSLAAAALTLIGFLVTLRRQKNFIA